LSTGRPPFPKKGKSRQSLGQFQRRGGRYTPRGSLKDLDRLVEEDPRKDKLDREPQLLEGLQSRGDSCIHFVSGVSRDTLEIAPRCLGDVIFVEEKGIDGESARMCANVVIVMGT